MTLSLPHLGVGDLDVKSRVLAVRRLAARLLDQVSDGADLVQHSKLCGSCRRCRVHEDTLALHHDLCEAKEIGHSSVTDGHCTWKGHKKSASTGCESSCQAAYSTQDPRTKVQDN